MKFNIRQAWTFTASVLLMTVASGCIDDASPEDDMNWNLFIRHIGDEVGNDTRASSVPIDREDAEEQVPFLVEALEASLQRQESVVIAHREQAKPTESYIDDLSGRGGYALELEFEGEFFSVDKISH